MEPEPTQASIESALAKVSRSIELLSTKVEAIVVAQKGQADDIQLLKNTVLVSETKSLPCSRPLAPVRDFPDAIELDDGDDSGTQTSVMSTEAGKMLYTSSEEGLNLSVNAFKAEGLAATWEDTPVVLVGGEGGTADRPLAWKAFHVVPALTRMRVRPLLVACVNQKSLEHLAQCVSAVVVFGANEQEAAFKNYDNWALFFYCYAAGLPYVATVCSERSVFAWENTSSPDEFTNKSRPERERQADISNLYALLRSIVATSSAVTEYALPESYAEAIVDTHSLEYRYLLRLRDDDGGVRRTSIDDRIAVATRLLARFSESSDIVRVLILGYCHTLLAYAREHKAFVHRKLCEAFDFPGSSLDYMLSVLRAFPIAILSDTPHGTAVRQAANVFIHGAARV